MTNIRILLSWLLLLLWYICIQPNDGSPPDKIDNTLFPKAWDILSREKKIMTNGKLSSLRDILGEDFTLTRQNFNSHLMIQLYNIFETQEPTNRDPIFPSSETLLSNNENYIQQYLEEIPPTPRIIHDDDDIVGIVQSIFELNLSKQNMIIFVAGDIQTGKTVALRRIHEEIINRDPSLWTIKIDIRQIFANKHRVQITQNIIFSAVIYDNVRSLFDFLLIHNPRRIVMLFDHIDYLTVERRNSLLTIINNLSNVGARIIMTGESSLELLINPAPTTLIYSYEIESLHFEEKVIYYENLWRKHLIPNVPHSEIRLNEYTVALVDILERAKLPETYITLQMIGQYLPFYRQQLTYIDGLRHLPVSYYDYVINGLPLPSDLLTLLEHEIIDKNKFWKEYLTHCLQRGSEYFMIYTEDILYDYLGKIAIANIIPELKNAAYFTNKKWVTELNDFGISLGILKQSVGDSVEFIYPQYELYVAAKIIIKYFATETLSVEFFRNVLFKDIKYMHLIDLINCQVNALDTTKLMVIVNQNHQLQTTILDRFIQDGFANLFHLIASNLTPHPADMLSFKNYLSGSESMSELKITDRPFWGFLPVPASTRSSYIFNNRMELLIEQNMVQKLSWVWRNNFKFNDPIVAQRVIRSVMIQPLPHMHIWHMVLAMFDHNIIDPNRLMYDVVYELGDGCRDAVAFIRNQFRSVIPSDVRVNGGTLLHAAARWASRPLFKYILDLQVPPIDTFDNTGKTVLSTALNANPATWCPPRDWWKSIAFLLEKITDLKIAVRANLPARHQADMSFRFAEMILETRRPDQEIFFPWIGEINDILTDRQWTLFRIRPVAKWNIPMAILEARQIQIARTLRNQNQRTIITEILANYGYLVLDEDRNDYRMTISFSLQYERNILSVADKLRLYSTLLKNADIANDFNGLKNLLDNYLLNGMGKAARELMAMEMEHTITPDKREIYTESKELAAFIRNPSSGNNAIKYSDYPRTLSLDQKIQRCKTMILELISTEHIHELEHLTLDMDIPQRLEIAELLLGRIKIITMSSTTTIQADQRDQFLAEARKLWRTLRHDISESHDDVNDGDGSNSCSFDIDSCLRRHKRSITCSLTCYFGWRDIDSFNDATVSSRRVINEIRVNSDNFLQTLAIAEATDKLKAEQLVELMLYLNNKPLTNNLLTGKSIMLLREILKDKSLIAYQHNQRIKHITNELIQRPIKNSLIFSLTSKTIALRAAAAIPFIRGFYTTIITCLEQSNGTNTNCMISGGALGISTLTIAVGYVGPRLLPCAIDGLSRAALDMLPTNAPIIIRDNIKLFRDIGLKRGGKALQRTVQSLILLSIGFDIFNIVETSKMINMCSQPDAECLSKDTINSIISLTFSCVSIAVTGGLLLSGAGFATGIIVGLVMLIIESFAFGINTVVYYSNKYHTDLSENVSIFFRSLILLGPSAHVRAYTQRQDWVNNLQKYGTNLLEDTDDNIVAYATGIGKFHHDDTITASYGYINMQITDIKHTIKLSRVLPQANAQTLLLCLPKEDTTKDYERYPNNVTDAVYSCRNTFVIANKQQWNKRNHEKSYILYDLEYINEGKIAGSNTINNLYLIGNSTKELFVIGGYGNITNTFIIRNDLFNGEIFIGIKSRSNIIDMSRINSTILQFDWWTTYAVGTIKFNNNVENSFTLTAVEMLTPNLHIIGRKNKQDIITCNYHYENQSIGNNGRTVTIDSGGGQSSDSLDEVNDCSVSVVRPFTRIVGSNSTNVTYTAHLWLETSFLPSSEEAIATIEIKQSTFILIFVHRPFFSSINSIMYNADNKTLTLTLNHADYSTLILRIWPYHTGDLSETLNSTNTTKAKEVNCIFIDGYFGTRITLTIQPTDNNHSVIVRNFNVFSTVNSSVLTDVFEHYNLISTHQTEQFDVTTKLTNPTTNQTYTIGSLGNDRFLIDKYTSFLYGSGGCDVYVLNKQSPNYIWIDNEADDYALDTLIVTDTTCNSLYAKSGSVMFDCCDNSTFDVTLYCSDNNITATKIIHVVLRNYLMHSNYRHLQIYWHDELYILLPQQWLQQVNEVLISKIIQFALFISFNGYYHKARTLTLTYRDTYVVFDVHEVKINPFVAYKSGFNDIVLTRRDFHSNNSLFIILEGFLANGTNNIALDWQQTKYFIANDNDRDNELNPMMPFTVEDIQKIYLNTLVDDNTTENSDFMVEYFININDTSKGSTIVIEHNANATEHGKLGVLLITGAEPDEFHANWNNDVSGTSLVLCAHEICVHVKNWCQPIHRLYRMEFFVSLDRRPIIINNIHQIKCQEYISVVEELMKKFNIAQLQLQLADDNDKARLMRCVGSFIVASVTNNLSYKLLGFTSLFEQREFIRDNCRVLFTIGNLKNLTLLYMKENFGNMINIYGMSENIKIKDKVQVKRVQNALNKLDDYCWGMLINSLIDLTNINDNNITSIDILNDPTNSLLTCLNNL